MLRSLFFLGTFIALSPLAHAQDTGVSFRIHHQYQGTRPLGMGDAFVAVANDYNAILYNPAGLARFENGEVNLFLDANATSTFQTSLKEIQDAQATPGTQAEKEDAMMTALQKQYGKTFGFRSALFSGFYARPNFGIAVIPADTTLEATIHQGVGPSVNTTLYADTTVALAYADNLETLKRFGIVSWGLTAKFINRGYFSKSINFTELAADPNLVKASDIREGFGIDADFGLLYTPKIPGYGLFSLLRYTRPTFGLVVRNVAETKFTSNMKLLNKDDPSTTPPEKLYRVVDIGTRWEYPSFWIFSGRGVMDFRDIMHPLYNTRKGLHLGLEFDWTVASWWKGNYRVGLSEGYYTAGISALLGLFNLDLVTYGEDVGTYSTPIESRVYGLRLNFNW